ncbi:MAG: hypothetical protein F7C38_03785 [Desulfurococcales archaeon]|nr:hypothetical protein [Desulfurococcales archaeon]
MGKEIDIPEDVLEDLIESISEIKGEASGRSKRKQKLPSTRDLAQIVAEAALSARGINPDEFPDIVRRLLEENGFTTRYVTDKRIWRTYELLVRRGVIPDTLGVVVW